MKTVSLTRARRLAAILLGPAVASACLASTPQGITILTSPADFSPSRTHDGFEEPFPVGQNSVLYEFGVGGTTFSLDDPSFPIPRIIQDPNSARSFPLSGTKALDNSGSAIDPPLTIQFASPVNRVGFHIRNLNNNDLDLLIQCHSGGVCQDTVCFTTGLQYSFVGVESDVAFDQIVVEIVGPDATLFLLDDLLFESVLDSDGDGLSDDAEADLGTDPFDPDSDDDGVSDGDEVAAQQTLNCPDPLEPDSDGDGLDDGTELLFAPITDPCDQDTDGDGLADGSELSNGTDPLNPDTDGDGLSDGAEVGAQINGCPDPLNPDSDGDLLSDGAEFNAGLAICDPDTDGDGMPDGIDSSPNDPGDFSDEVAQATDDIATGVSDPGMLGEFESAVPGNAPSKLAESRQNTLSNQIAKAGRQIEKGNLSSARGLLASVLERLEDPGAWSSGPGTDALILELQLLISALDAQL